MSPSGYLPKFERMLRLPGKVTLRHHQMLRLPRKITVQCVTQIIWCIIYNDGWFNHIENNLTMEVQNWTCPFPELTFSFSNALYGQVRHVALRQSTTIWPHGAPAKKSDTRTSPKAAPATKSHAPTSPWQPVPRKGTLKHHQMSRLPRKVTVQYCACHTIRFATQMAWRVITMAEDSRPIREWCEHEVVISHPPVRRGYVLRFGRAFCIGRYNIWRACEEKWRSNITKCCACHETWHSNITKCCACCDKGHSNITKCRACHKKCRSNISKYCPKSDLRCEWCECCGEM